MQAPEKVIPGLKSRLSVLEPTARFRGFSEDDVREAERRIGLTLPPLLRQFMLTMGDYDGGLLQGSDLPAPEELPQFREDAEALLAESGSKSRLPPSAVVFVFHQGYAFLYLEADFDNGPVFQYVEGESEPQQVSASLADFFEAELRLKELHS